jgi:PPOX class probable F420-dependent enzyme
MTDQPTADPVAIATLAPPLPLPESVRVFLAEPRFATISTIDPDGMPRNAVIWYLLEGDELVLNSAVGRRWPSNLERDPRLALSVVDATDGYRWVGLTGTVEIVTDRETTQADIAAMARRYHADDPAKAERLITGRFERQDRISFRLRATNIHDERDE